jgi:hypothetical protein
MPYSEIAMDLRAKDNMSAVLDHITQRFGIFSKSGIAMGIAFAGINKGIDLLTQTISGMINYIQQGTEMNRAFDLSLAHLSVSMNDFDMNLVSVRSELLNFSALFATDVNDMTNGLKQFIREGNNMADSMRLLYEAGRLQVTTGEDLITVQEAMSTTMQVFGYEANAAGYITSKLNDLTSATTITLTDINTVLSRSAVAAQKAGINYEDLINIIYTFHERGVATRNIIAEINKLLEDPSLLASFKAMVLPAADVSIADKYKTIAGTVAFTAEQVKELRKQSQMRLSGGWDVGAGFDKETVRLAQKLTQARKDNNTEYLKTFAYRQKEQAGNPLFLAAKMLGQPLGVDLQNVSDLADAYGELAAQEKDAADANAAFLKVSPLAQLKQIHDEVIRLNGVLADNNAVLAKTGQELGDLTEMRMFTIDTHNATAAITEQEDAIKGLQHVADAYSLSQMKNSLQIMKIEYNVDSRHGLDRTQKEAIAALEKTNAGLQISEMENQIEISTIQQNGLYQAQNALDAIKQQHDQVMYDREIRDLDANIAAKNALYASTLTAIQATNVLITAEQDKWRDNELIKTISWSKNMHQWHSYAQGGGTAGTTGTTTTTAAAHISTLAERWTAHINLYHHGLASLMDKQLMAAHREPIPGLASGGTVTQTGVAVVHRGELVIPNRLVGNVPHMRESASPVIMPAAGRSGDTHVKIDVGPVNITANNAGNVQEWGKKLGAGLAAGFFSTTNGASQSVISHKTGTSVIVPGTQVTVRTGRTPTNNAIVQFPTTTKTRFRVG